MSLLSKFLALNKHCGKTNLVVWKYVRPGVQGMETTSVFIHMIADRGGEAFEIGASIVQRSKTIQSLLLLLSAFGYFGGEVANALNAVSAVEGCL
jgi:hypothetical protein